VSDAVSQKNSVGGFTFIEVILAIIIISIAVLVLISSISFTTRNSLNAEMTSTAQQLAQERLEQLIAQKRNNGYGSLVPIGLGAYAPIAGFSGYERREDICYVDAGLAPNFNPPPTVCNAAATNFKQVTVSVRYTLLQNPPTVSLMTVVTNFRE
jgi:type II secretory pathway pseudopilin PulG